MSCPNEENCRKGVTEEGGQYFCPKCEKHYSTFIPRFILSLCLADHTGTIWPRCFGNDGQTLLGKTCREIVDLEETDKTQFEIAFLEARYKHYNVRVKCSPPYGESDYVQYTIANLVPLNPKKNIKRMNKLIEELTN